MLARPQTLLALLALTSFVQAGWFDETLNEVVRRQADTNVSETASVPEVSESSTPPIESTTSDTPSPTPEVTTTPSVSPTPSASPTPTTTPPSATPGSTTPVTSTTLETSATPATESSSTTASVEEQSSSARITPSTTVISQTVIVTVDGQVITSVSESTSTLPLPSGTNAAGLANGSETTGGGMSSKTKSTVIGVVVGIGGAILLAGLAVVAWRIWGRKKNGDEGDDLMEYNRPDTGAEKTLNSSNGGASTNPFQSTLENYHNPAKQVNASSNF